MVASRSAMHVSAAALRCLELAVEVARECGHPYVGTEHLLYGAVVSEPGCDWRRPAMLVAVERVYEETLGKRGLARASVAACDKPLATPKVRDLISAMQARASAESPVGRNDLLVALMGLPESAGARRAAAHANLELGRNFSEETA